jgi:transmembrane sensor
MPTIGGDEGAEGHGGGIDYASIARYLAGESNDAEIQAIEARVAADPEFELEVERIRVIWASGVGQQPDVEAALRRVMGAGVVSHDVRSSALATGRSPSRRRVTSLVRAWGGSRWWTGVAAAAVVVASVGVVITSRARLTSGPSVAMREYLAAPGQRLNVTLSDGSQFALAPNSRVLVPVTYGIAGRQVELDGEAFFTVVHDAARPFQVRARNAEVTDVGTAFDVKAYAGDSAVGVAVAEGRVSLAASLGTATALGIGDVAAVSSSGSIRTGHTRDLAPYIGWTRGELVFQDVPLRDVVPVLERWYGLTIVLTDSALGRRPIYATYAMQSMTEVLQLVTSTVGAEYTRRGQTIWIVPGPAMMHR